MDKPTALAVENNIDAAHIFDQALQAAGFEVELKTIRGASYLSKTRIIMATAFPRLAQKLRNGADLVLLKPIPYEKLRDLSRKLVASAA